MKTIKIIANDDVVDKALIEKELKLKKVVFVKNSGSEFIHFNELKNGEWEAVVSLRDPIERLEKIEIVRSDAPLTRKFRVNGETEYDINGGACIKLKDGRIHLNRAFRGEWQISWTTGIIDDMSKIKEIAIDVGGD